MSKFDEVAKVWDAKPMRLHTAELIYKAVAEKLNLNNKLKVADIGTGTGLLLIHILPHIKEIHGYDNSQEMLNMLNAKIKKAELNNVKSIFFDADSDEFTENYDLFVSSMTFHHIENLQSFFRKIYKATNKAGKIAIADLESEDGSFHSQLDETVKHLGFDKHKFTEYIKNAGFKNVVAKTIFEINKQGKKYPVFLATAQK